MNGFTGDWIPEAYGVPTASSEVNRLASFFSGESLAAFVTGRSEDQNEERPDAKSKTNPVERD